MALSLRVSAQFSRGPGADWPAGHPGWIRAPRLPSFVSAEPKNILHRIKTRLPPPDPTRGAQRSLRERLATGGSMGQFQPFAVAGKNHGVISHRVATAHGVHPDLAGRSLAHQAFTTVA